MDAPFGLRLGTDQVHVRSSLAAHGELVRLPVNEGGAIGFPVDGNTQSCQEPDLGG